MNNPTDPKCIPKIQKMSTLNSLIFRIRSQGRGVLPQVQGRSPNTDIRSFKRFDVLTLCLIRMQHEGCLL